MRRNMQPDSTGWDIRRYSGSCKQEWDGFVSTSRNGTFLFMRDYMDYHADRFDDCSLMIYHEGKLKALLPAHRMDNVFCSHKGLTYGGLVTDKTMKSKRMMELFDEIMKFLRRESMVKWIYSPIPYIYSKYPSEEDLYALYCFGACLVSRKISTVVLSSEEKIRFSEPKCRNVRRALREGLVLCQDEDFKSFWDILEQNLEEKYGTKPVHSLEEIQRLHKSFPENIVLYRVCDAKGFTIAGCVMYLTDKVAHTQYISSTTEGRDKRAVDFLFDRLINDIYKDKPYFDLGTSVEQGGLILNEGLIHQKESFGGRAVVYDTYELTVR